MNSPTEFSYCESIHASGSSPWHIRRLTDVGRRLSGGIDTPSLCGHVRPPKGWDLVRGPADDKIRMPHVCVKCFDIWWATQPRCDGPESAE